MPPQVWGTKAVCHLCQSPLCHCLGFKKVTQFFGNLISFIPFIAHLPLIPASSPLSRFLSPKGDGLKLTQGEHQLLHGRSCYQIPNFDKRSHSGTEKPRVKLGVNVLGPRSKEGEGCASGTDVLSLITAFRAVEMSLAVISRMLRVSPAPRDSTRLALSIWSPNRGISTMGTALQMPS